MGKLIRINMQYKGSNERKSARAKISSDSIAEEKGRILMFTGVRYERHNNYDANSALIQNNKTKRG